MPSMINSQHLKSGRRTCLRTMILGAALAGTGYVPLTFADKKERIISIGSAITDALYALNAQSDIVGVDTTSTYPAVAKSLPQVGYARTLSAEGILALAPTKIIATEEAGPPAVLRQISNSGVSVVIIPSHYSIEGVTDRIQKIGDLISKQKEAQQLVTELQSQWTTTQTEIHATKSVVPRILFVLSHSPNQIMVAGKNTGAEAIIQYAGAKNAIEAFSGYKTLTPEAVIAAQPDLVLFTDQGLTAIGGVDNALKLPGILQTPAGKKHRIISMEAVLMLGFGTRLPLAVQSLHRTIIRAIEA